MNSLIPVPGLYTENIQKLKEHYSPPRKPFDILDVQAYRPCVGCNSTSHVQRHHKANDYVFACLRPERYARRYLEFRTEEVAYVCDKCHLELHQHAYRELHIEVLRLAEKRRMQGKRIALTYTDCEKYRKKFLRLFSKWLEGLTCD